MDHFPIIQALCRTVLSQPSVATRRQVERLRDALKKAGDTKESAIIAGMLTKSGKSVELAPARIVQSRAETPGEELTSKTQLPVDRETSAPLAEVVFPKDLRRDPPIFPDIVDRAIQSVIGEWQFFEALLSLDVHPARTCLIYGAPGTGKTRLALWIAAQLNIPVVTAQIDGLVSSFLGTTSRNIGSLFNFVNRYRCLLLLDEFDALAKVRDDPHEVGEIKRVVNTLLQNLDTRQNIGITIGITNHQCLLDPAIWRRFEIQIEIPKPEFDLRMILARNFMPPLKVPESHLRLIAWFTEGGSGAETEALVRTYKKTMAMQGVEPKHLLDTLRQFATLNSARLSAAKRDLLFNQDAEIFTRWKNDRQLKFSFEDIATVVGKDKSTISRMVAKHRTFSSENKGERS